MGQKSTTYLILIIENYVEMLLKLVEPIVTVPESKKKS